MNRKIILKAGKLSMEAELNSSAISRMIYDKLPIKARVNTWGDEIYFPIPVKAQNENGVSTVKIGDIAYCVVDPRIKFDRMNSGSSVYYNMEWGGSSQRADLFMQWLTTIDPNAPNNPRVERGISGMNFMDKNYSAPNFLSGRYPLDNWNYNLGYLNWIAQNFYTDHAVQYWVDGPQSFNSIYNETEKLAASYIMAELKAGSDLLVVPGIRWEQLQGDYGAYAVYTNNSNQISISNA